MDIEQRDDEKPGGSGTQVSKKNGPLKMSNILFEGQCK